MSGLVPGYEYDIFISYRQKDNKYDGWVTEFISNLKHELESTFTEEINVYFDQNPIDGILENHDVDDSLRMKLKCLIFIPIISRTYCDPRSFAWKYEFKTFIEEASADEFGLKVKLQNGNVASRVLPVRIYDLDRKNVELCEKLAGGSLRGIDFIYKSSGVNRPLRAGEDHPGDNIVKIYYRDQINKLANSIREILESIAYPQKPVPEPENKAKVRISFNEKRRYKLGAAAALALFIFVIASIIITTKFFEGANEKSVAVLPFINNSNESEQGVVNGMCEEITNKLFMVGEVNIPAYSTTIIYKGSNLENRKIARQLKVSHLLVGSVTKSGQKLRVSATLIEGRTGKMKWTEEYTPDVNETNYFDIISDIANKVVKSLKIVLNQSLEDRINYQSTNNTDAIELYLRAMNPEDYSKVRELLEEAIALDPKFADAHAELGYWWLHQGGYGGYISREEVFKKATPLLSKALEIDPNSVVAHYSNALLNLYYVWDFKTVGEEYNIVKNLAPSNPELKSFFIDYLIASERFHEAFTIAKDAFENYPESANNYITLALTSFFNNQSDKTPPLLTRALSLYPEYPHLIVNAIRLYNYMGMYNSSLELYNAKFAGNEENFKIPYLQGHIAIALYKRGNPDETNSILDHLIEKSDTTTNGSPAYFASAILTAMGQNEKALDLLEKAFDKKEVEMYWLKVEPLFRSLHGDPRFEKLISRIGYN